jgi:hypothetical protein
VIIIFLIKFETIRIDQPNAIHSKAFHSSSLGIALLQRTNSEQ